MIASDRQDKTPSNGQERQEDRGRRVLPSVKAVRKEAWPSPACSNPEDVAGVVLLACTKSSQSRIVGVTHAMAEALA
jgi:hypothetical protein